MKKYEIILAFISVVAVITLILAVITEINNRGAPATPKPVATTLATTTQQAAGPPAPPAPTAIPDSLEYQLATINAGGYVSENDVTVVRFRHLLTSLANKTKNTPQQISDMTVRGRTLLREKFGKEIKLLELMEGANDSIPDDSPIKFDYAEIISALVVLMGR